MLQSQPSEADRKVFVGGLPSFSTERSLYSYFSQFGEIEDVNIVMDKHTNRSKGYGFVLFKEAVSAYASVTNPYPFIDGKSCNCNIASLGAKPQGTQKKGGKRSHPSETDDLQSKRMKTERSKSKHSYIQQLQQELNIEITKEFVLSNIEQMKLSTPAPDVFKYLLEMMDIFEDSQEEYQKLYNELLEASREYRKMQVQGDRMQQLPDGQQFTGNAIYNGKEINYQNIEEGQINQDGQLSEQTTQQSEYQDQVEEGQVTESVQQKSNQSEQQQQTEAQEIKNEQLEPDVQSEQQQQTEVQEIQNEQLESDVQSEQQQQTEVQETQNEQLESDVQSEQQLPEEQDTQSEQPKEVTQENQDEELTSVNEQNIESKDVENINVNVQNEEVEEGENIEPSESNQNNEFGNDEDEYEDEDDEGSSYHEE